jgi:hypothetical protein
LASAVVAGLGREASGHLVSTELGPFYDGAAHPVVTPEDLLTILALAVLAAFGGAYVGRRLLVSLVVGWTVGVAAAFGVAGGVWEAPLATAGVLLLLGVAGLLKARVSAGSLAAGGFAIGLMRGVLNGSAARVADGQWLSVLGIVAGVFVVAALLTGLSLWVAKRGGMVVLRVGGSWIAAIGLLMLGWELRSAIAPGADGG